MAYIIPSGAILEIQYRCRLGDQQCINVFHYLNNFTIEDGRAAAEEAAQYFWEEVGLAIATAQTADVTAIHVRAQWVHPVRYAFVEYTPDPNAGVAMIPTLSIGTCVVLKKLTDLAGHSHRGRAFIPGAPVADSDIGLLTVGGFATWDAVAQNLVKDMEVVGGTVFLDPVIWSYTDPTNTDEIVQATADQVLRYQRRREVGRGE